MDALIVDVADAIASALSSAVFSPPYADVEAEMTYEPFYDIEKMSELKIFVVPKATATSLIARTTKEEQIQVDIGVQKKQAKRGAGETNKLMWLVSEIKEFLWTTKKFGGCRVIGVENEPAFSPEHMISSGVFTSVVTVTLLKVGT